MDEDNNQSRTESVLLLYLDGRTVAICVWILFPVVCQAINCFGIVTNIINIMCFVKQGFTDSTNISLLGLSVSDLGGLVTLVCMCILFTPAVDEADLPFDGTDVQYLVFGMPHFAFSRVSAWITAVISLERCLSIVAPFKVKRIVSPTKTRIIVTCIFIIFTFSSTPIYIVSRLGLHFSISRNKTIFGLIFTDNKEEVEMYTFSINNFFIPFCTFIIIVVCTVILIIQLRINSESRKGTVSDVQEHKLSSRNKKVAKMVVTISTLFIICFIPTTIIMLTVAFIPDLSATGKYVYVTKIIGGFTFTLESINSSVNIFIYHHMSTKYRDTFRTLFRRKKNILANAVNDLYIDRM